MAASAAGRPRHLVVAVGDAVDPAALGLAAADVEVRAQVPQLAVLAHARAADGVERVLGQR